MMFFSKNTQRTIAVLLGTAGFGTFWSLHKNHYDVNSIGAVRLTRAAYTVFECSFIYRSRLYSTNLDKDSPEYQAIKSHCHLLSAQKLLKLCCTNRGVYIKVGQHLAALDYLVPPEYVQTMKVLHSNAPTNCLQDVYKVIHEDLRQTPEDIFSDFDREPLGTASLAQVHKATLHDGTVVAVKVQHPYVQGNSKVDMKTMEYLVKLVGWLFPDFNFQWLVDESKKNIPRELDFEQEGRNAEKVAKMFTDVTWLKIPKIRWDLTTSRVLTMDFLEGGQVNDLDYIQKNHINPYEVSDKLGKLYSRMIFINGFVHSDPHPGNILIRKASDGKNSCEVVLLDHGLYADLSDYFRIEYANLWLSILDRDRVGMRLHSKNLGIEGNLYGLFACMITGRTWETILKGVDKAGQTKGERDVLQRELPNVLPQIAGILDRVNRQMLLILKTNDLMRGIEHTLRTSARMGAFRVMSECCVESIYSQRFDEANSTVVKFKVTCAKYWALFKISLYYTLIHLSRCCSEKIPHFLQM